MFRRRGRRRNFRRGRRRGRRISGYRVSRGGIRM